MTGSTDIISSKIVSSEWDTFWESSSSSPENTGEVNTLVLSLPYTTGTSEDVQLQKILQACMLSPDQYLLVQIEEGKNLAWHQLRDKAKPKNILLFGILPQQLGISAMFRLFQPNHFNDCIWVPGLSLTELEKQPEAKKQLWQNGLKPVFVDKTYQK